MKAHGVGLVFAMIAVTLGLMAGVIITAGYLFYKDNPSPPAKVAALSEGLCKEAVAPVLLKTDKKMEKEKTVSSGERAEEALKKTEQDLNRLGLTMENRVRVSVKQQ